MNARSTASALLMVFLSTVLAATLAFQVGVPTASAHDNDDRQDRQEQSKKQQKKWEKQRKHWRQELARRIREARRHRHHNHHHKPHTGSGSTASGSTASGTLIDISITKDDGKLTVNPGQSNTYTITVTNNGPSAASPAYIMDQLPSQYDPATVVASCGSCSFVSGNGTSTIYAEAHLLAGQSAVLTITATVKSTVTPGTVIMNTAFAGSALDANETNKNNNGYDDATLVVAVQN